MIIKPDPNEDFYVDWSTEIDNWVVYGTREQFLKGDTYEEMERRLRRADEVGTSYMVGSIARWGGSAPLVHEFEGYDGDYYYTISLENLRKWCYTGDITLLNKFPIDD